MGELLVALYLASGAEAAVAAKPPIAEIEVRCEYGSAVYIDGVDVATCLEDRVSMTVRPGRHRVEVRGADRARKWGTAVVVFKGERASLDVERGTVAIEAGRRHEASVVASLTVARSAAVTGEPVELRVAQDPYAFRVATQFRLETGGRVSYKLVDAGDQAAVARALAARDVDLALLTGAGLDALVPSLRVFDLPMLFKRQDELDAVRGALLGDIEQAFDKAGLVWLGWADPGLQFLIGGSDLSDLSAIDVLLDPDQAHLHAWVAAAGGNPISSYAEHKAKSRVVLIKTSHRVDRSVLVANASGVVVMSSAVWARLSLEDQQSLVSLVSSLQEGLRKQEERLVEVESEARARQRVRAAPPAPSPELIAALEKVAGEENAKYAAKVGGEKLLEAIQAELAKLRAPAATTP